MTLRAQTTSSPGKLSSILFWFFVVHLVKLQLLDDSMHTPRTNEMEIKRRKEKRTASHVAVEIAPFGSVVILVQAHDKLPISRSKRKCALSLRSFQCHFHFLGNGRMLCFDMVRNTIHHFLVIWDLLFFINTNAITISDSLSLVLCLSLVF